MPHCSTVCKRTGARQLELHVGETTIAFPLRDGAARELSGAITTLLQTLASKQAAERPRRWPAMEFKLEGAQLPTTARSGERRERLTPTPCSQE